MGLVSTLGTYTFELNDLVVCRTTAPVITIAYKLMKGACQWPALARKLCSLSRDGQSNVRR